MENLFNRSNVLVFSGIGKDSSKTVMDTLRLTKIKILNSRS